MKYPYLFVLFSLAFTIMVSFLTTNTFAQCPNSGTPGSTAYDTTIAFPTGTTSIPVKFPQFDPQSGVVTCVRLCVTITGVIDSLAMQNFAASAQTGTFNYIRNDQITGPGFSTPLSNSVSLNYGPYNLTAYDGIPGAGTDFYSTAHDTILNQQLCRTLSDSTTIVQFYGTDSVTYNYDISVATSANITGGSSSALVLTSAFVNFHFEYCTCPAFTLPANIYDFDVTKLPDNNVLLSWKEAPAANAYQYEIEMSKNGNEYNSIAIVSKNLNGNHQYFYSWGLPGEGRYFFRIRKKEPNGRFYLSEIKSVNMISNNPIKFSMYPNPSNGIVGIKFDNISAGKYLVLINNTQGQTVVQKEIDVRENSYLQIARLQRGSYWMRLIHVTSQLSCVSQLLIK